MTLNRVDCPMLAVGDPDNINSLTTKLATMPDGERWYSYALFPSTYLEPPDTAKYYW